MKKRVGIVADDITGANDIGLMLCKNGYRAAVFSQAMEPPLGAELWQRLDAVVIDTNSRLDAPADAARKTREATEQLMALGCEVYCGKTCSVFRGNVGAQLETMREMLGGCGMVVLGFPQNGRTTVNGKHFVYGTPLSQTMFAHDPIHPMQEDDLLEILRSQCTARVSGFPYPLLELPQGERQGALEKMREEADFIIFDVRDQGDLRTLAELLKDAPYLCGSSALWEELPRAWGDAQPQAPVDIPWQDDRGCLVLAGSLTEPTRRQVNCMREAGVESIKLPTWELFDPAAREALCQSLTARLAAQIIQGKDALLYTAQEADEVAHTKALGYAQGWTDSQIGWCISGVLSQIAAAVMEKTGARKIVTAGGDTSASISQGLGVEEMEILCEIEPGVPAMLGRGRNTKEKLLVYKSGSFGSDTFLLKSVACLKELGGG